MSYEGEMLRKLRMPARKEVETALLKTLFKHNGTIKEFATGEEIVEELADSFGLTQDQRDAVLERIYRKENRLVKTPLWHRLLYRAADSLAKEKRIVRPNQTYKLTNKKEWMLTEDGYQKAMNLLKIPAKEREILPIKSYEVQRYINKQKTSERPLEYDPFKKEKGKKMFAKWQSIRSRSFRQIVVESYDHRCSVCGLKIKSPDNSLWEVEAAHIVPHEKDGKDEIWNGIALCRLHHWAFDVGWFSLTDDYGILVSPKYDNLPLDYGKLDNFEFLKPTSILNKLIIPPKMKSLLPHHSAIEWHRNNIFFK